MLDSLAAVGGLAYLIVIAFDGVWQLLGKPFRDLDLALSFDKLKNGQNCADKQLTVCFYLKVLAYKRLPAFLLFCL